METKVINPVYKERGVLWDNFIKKQDVNFMADYMASVSLSERRSELEKIKNMVSLPQEVREVADKFIKKDDDPNLNLGNLEKLYFLSKCSM